MTEVVVDLQVTTGASFGEKSRGRSRGRKKNRGSSKGGAGLWVKTGTETLQET